MSYTFSNLAQQLYFDLGQVSPLGLFSATGGSTTTFINTAWGSLENPPEEDFAKSYLAIVVRDAGGASAAPESEYSLVSAYAEGSQTGTIGTLTAAVASGDKLMLAAQDKFPIESVLFAVNRALQELGDVPLVDTSLTGVSGQTEYTLPEALTRTPPLAIFYQTAASTDELPVPVYDWKYSPPTIGSTGKIYMEVPADKTIIIWYRGVHPNLTAYNSEVAQSIHPEIALLATKIRLYEWWNSQEGAEGDSLSVWKESTQWPNQLAMKMAEHPFWSPPDYKPFSRR